MTTTMVCVNGLCRKGLIMRDILFKAKRLRDGEWVEGVPVNLTPSYCFESDNNIPQRWVMAYGDFADWGLPRDVVFEKIDPDTICQYTGLRDDDGNKIFEGDILEVHITTKLIQQYIVEFNTGSFYTKTMEGEVYEYLLYNMLWVHSAKVVDNIYDEKECD